MKKKKKPKQMKCGGCKLGYHLLCGNKDCSCEVCK